MACWEQWTPIFLMGLLVLAPFLIYWDAIWGGFVSDDIAGIQDYDGKIQQPISWHNLFKKLRYEYGKTPNKNLAWKEQKQRPFLPSSHAHHRLNILLLCGSAGLLYGFLCRITTSETAFLSTLLFIAHPLGCQTIAWISGVGYVLSLLFMLAGLNVGFLVQEAPWFHTPLGLIGGLCCYGFFQWMAVEAQFATVGVVIILLWLKWWPMAIVAGILAIYQCLHTLKEAVELRRKVFHEQQMAASTYFSLKKLIVMVKTIAYDTKLAVFPKRLGLYHTFNYHYPLPYVETEDKYFWAGLLFLLSCAWGVFAGSHLVQFSILWFLSYIILFSNAITANQFVVDRYVWIPSFSVCLLAAVYLPSWTYWVMLGIFIMRTWSHIPTYVNDMQFYLSNVWNFPTSEVAMGNLGVTYMSHGLIGSAFDTWTLGSKLNPDYDVNWYNLYSMIRSRGQLNPNYAPIFHSALPPQLLDVAFNKDPMRSHFHISRYCLQRAVNARTCHFPKPWQEELLKLDQELSRPANEPLRVAQLVQPLLTPALT